MESKNIWNFKNFTTFHQLFSHLFHFANVIHHNKKLGNFSFSNQNFPKSVFPVESKTNEHYHWLQQIGIRLGTNFLTRTSSFDLDQTIPKKVFPVQNKTNEYHHWTQNIWISLSTKFDLKLTILSFWIKFAPKDIFGLKQRNWTSP